MASRLTHLSISRCIEQQIYISDINRFRLGHILPDAVVNADKSKVNTHFVTSCEINRKIMKVMDFFAFYNRFADRIMNDSLYLGYYFHLIEDDIYRQFLYYDLGYMHKRGENDFIERLYRDYHIINGNLTEEYSLDIKLIIPDNFSAEAINDIYKFDIAEFITDMKKDVEERYSEAPKLFSFSDIKKYIDRCTFLCQKEYISLNTNKNTHFISPSDFLWEASGEMPKKAIN